MDWLKTGLQLRGSITPKVLPRALAFGLIGLIVSSLDYFKIPIFAEIIGGISTNVVFNFILGLLLVFRTNTAYDRFWEGRKTWGQIIINTRNLARQIKVAVIPKDADGENNKTATLRLLTAFAVTTKLHLRKETINQELDTLVSASQLAQLQQVKNPPLQIMLWISNYLEQQHQKNCLSGEQLININRYPDQIVEALTGCERISSTPIPLAYAIYLRLLLLIYCSILPFQIVDKAGWYTGLIVTLITFILLGVEEIGTEIEDPFGRDQNDLPVENFCQNISNYIEELITMDLNK